MDRLDPEVYKEGEVIVNGCTPAFATRVQVLAAGTEEQLAIDTARRAALLSWKSCGLVKSKLAIWPTAEEPPVETPISSEEFNRRCEASMPSVPDWSEEEDGVDSEVMEMIESSSARPPPSIPNSGLKVTVSSLRQEELNRNLVAAAPLQALSSWADDVDEKDAEAAQEADIPVMTQVQVCLAQSEVRYQRSEATGPFSTNASWTDDTHHKNEEVFSPRPSSGNHP
ncbi:hypothetical protein LTR93_011198 [Exophiala xenobiotica]|nr:hypothetical protein LTR93_011198 [Exophiala xenobiotica]